MKLYILMYLNFQSVCVVCVCLCVHARTYMRMCMCGLEIFAICAVHLAIITKNAIPITFQPNIS